MGALAVAPGGALAAPSGLGTASVTSTSASASAVNLNGVLVLGRSDTTTSSQHVEVLQVAGIDLLSKNAADKNTGMLAAVGNVVDALNRALCRKGTEATGSCVALLFSNDSSGTGTVGGVPATNHNASYATLALTLGAFHLRLLGSSAATIVRTPTSGSPDCTNLALGYIVNTENVVPKNGNGNIGKKATVVGVPC